MVIKLTYEEIASAIAQAVGRQLQLQNGKSVKVRLVVGDNTVTAEADVGDAVITQWTEQVDK